MYQKFIQALNNMHKNQKGMTGLETAIILIAFVTVASVLAYSVLSAGIFSAETAKEDIYEGLATAQSTLKVDGSVLGLSANQTKLETVQFSIGLTIPNQTIDSGAILINYWDEEVHAEGITTTWALATGSTERGTASIIELDEQFTVTATIPASANITAYNTFSLQVLPPSGAALTVKRTLPGVIMKVMDLQ